MLVLTAMLLSSIATLIALSSLVYARQATFSSNANSEYFATTGREAIPPGVNMGVNNGRVDVPFNFTTIELGSLQSTDSFTALMHPDFPGHQVRIKKADFCDPTVK